MLYLDDAPYSHTFNRKTANPDGKPILLFDAAKILTFQERKTKTKLPLIVGNNRQLKTIKTYLNSFKCFTIVSTSTLSKPKWFL